MDELSFFDSSCRIGKTRIPLQTPKSYHNAESLIKEMKYFGINDALVYHTIAEYGHPSIGNEELLNDIKPYKQLHPCWVLLPHQTGEMDKPKKLIEDMLKKGVKAVRLFPAKNAHNFTLSEWMCGELFCALEDKRIPLFLSLLGITSDVFASWDRIDDICSKHPNLPVIISGSSLEKSRAFYALMGKHKNLYIDTSFFDTHRGIEDLCEKFGAERILFASSFGQISFAFITPAAPMMMVIYAKISKEEKKLIAHGNLQRLLGNVKLTSIRKEERKKSGKLMLTAQQGLPLKDVLIIDVHAHQGPDICYTPYNDAKGMVEEMDVLGINKSCISSILGIRNDCVLGNGLTIKAIREFPDRFIGYAAVNPNYPQEIEQELERCFKSGLRGIKIHPCWHNYPVTGPNYKPVWDFANKHQCIVLSHTQHNDTNSSPLLFDKVAKEYPAANFILGHSGNVTDGYKESIAVAKKRKNLWLETSGWIMIVLGVIEYCVEKIGADRILFGSDAVWISQAYALGGVVYAKIKDKDKRKILGLNAKRLFRI